MISCRLVQERAGYFPISATLAGMLRDLRLVQPVKASIPMRSRPAGRTTFSGWCRIGTAQIPRPWSLFQNIPLSGRCIWKRQSRRPQSGWPAWSGVLRLLQPAKSQPAQGFQILGEGHIRQGGALIKGGGADVRYAVRDLNAGELGVPTEGKVGNGGYALCQNHGLDLIFCRRPRAYCHCCILP